LSQQRALCSREFKGRLPAADLTVPPGCCGSSASTKSAARLDFIEARAQISELAAET